jgi:hypothetical protein
MRCHILHAVSMTPYAPCMRCQWYRMHRACGIIDTTCIFNIFCIPSLFCIWFSLFEVVLMKITEGRKSRDTVPLNRLLMNSEYRSCMSSTLTKIIMWKISFSNHILTKECKTKGRSISKIKFGFENILFCNKIILLTYGCAFSVKRIINSQ